MRRNNICLDWALAFPKVYNGNAAKTYGELASSLLVAGPSCGGVITMNRPSC